MQVVQKTPEKLILRMPANQSLANAIRRSITEIPVLAIDEAEIYKNDSALYDEMIAHRLGLVALKSEKVTSKTKVEFKLSKEGPCTVYSEDLEGPTPPVYGKIPITTLEDGKKIELTATATPGIGLDHAKYIPGIAYYHHILSVKSSPGVDKIVQASKNPMKPEKSGSKWLCDLTDAQEEEISKLDEDAVSDSDELLLTIESYGNMPASEVLEKAIKALGDNLDAFAKAVK
jgi:DNA-directed RNA polymerase subunit D